MVLRSSSYVSQQFRNEVAAPYATQFLFDSLSFLGFVPEEKHALRQFLTGIMGTEYWLHRVGVIASIPHFSADGHGGGGEILDLLQLEVQTFGGDCQFGHVFRSTTWMAADEIGDNLLVKSRLAIGLIEDALEFGKLFERGLAHQV